MAFETADGILGPALDEFYTHRPNALTHINYRDGVYWRPFAAFRAQASRAMLRVGQLASLNSLEAEGPDLRDYVSSEFLGLPQTDSRTSPLPTSPYGEVVLTRTASATSGVIPAGTKVVRLPNSDTQVPWEVGTYETLRDEFMTVGQTVSGRIPIVGSDGNSSSRGNHIQRTDSPSLVVISSGRRLFDQTLTVTSFDAAGGSDGQEDSYLRALARASSLGLYGPNDNAAILGALYGSGVRHAIAYDEVSSGSLVVVAGDTSWASSPYWAKRVQQEIVNTGLIGYGCQIRVDGVRNKLVRVQADVVLRDWAFTNDTAELSNSIQAAIRSYFDDRLDWNIWKSRSLKHTITRADSNILRCTSVTVTDATGVGTVPEISAADYSLEQFHYYLTQVECSFSGPV